VALQASLLRGSEDVKLHPVTIDTISVVTVTEKVDLMTVCVNDL